MSIKWAQPVYEVNGPMIFVKAFPKHVDFGFWRGAELDDPHGLLEGGGVTMRHVQLRSVGDVRRKDFQDFIRQAVKLNQKFGDPTKPKK